MAMASKDTPAMREMGVKRKDAYPSVGGPEKSDKDYNNELVRPNMSLDGKQAEMMGADDLEAGEYVKQTVIWKVKRVSKTETDGKKELSVSFDLCKASDLTEVDAKEAGEDEPADDKGEDETSESDGDKPSAGLAFILGKGASDEG